MKQYERGMTLIDVLVGSAVMLVIFLALFGMLRLASALSILANETSAATAIATDRIEAMRALPYDAIHDGEADATMTESGVPYRVYTDIESVDDPADGLGAGDRDANSDDYKSVSVAVSYLSPVGLRTISFVTIIASGTPPAISP